MAAARPKPRYDGKQKPPYGEFLDWLDRQCTEVLGSSYTSLKAYIDAAVAAGVAAIDLSDIEDELADHETRIDDLEAAETAFKTTWVMGSCVNVGTTASTTYYHQISGYNTDTTPPTTIEERRMVWGLDGAFTSMLYQNMESVADSDTYSWTLLKNGSATALTITGLAPNDTTPHEVTASVSVVKGDLLVLRQVNGGAGLTGNCNPAWWLNFVEAA